MRIKKNKKAAIELSMTTIVVVVLSLILLIMGFVLVRSTMCSSIGIVTDVGKLSKDQINSLLGATGGEVQCIGAEGDPLSVYTGYPKRTNVIRCVVKAPSQAKYSFKLDINEKYSTIKKDIITKWLVSGDEWTVAPGDEEAKPIGQLRIPNEAPAGDIALDLEIKKDGVLFRNIRLQYTVSRVGVIQSAMC